MVCCLDGCATDRHAPSMTLRDGRPVDISTRHPLLPMSGRVDARPCLLRGYHNWFNTAWLQAVRSLIST